MFEKTFCFSFVLFAFKKQVVGSCYIGTVARIAFKILLYYSDDIIILSIDLDCRGIDTP